MATKFCNKLKRIREKAGMTQAEIAKMLGVPTARVSQWEREFRTPKPLTQEGILMRLERLKAKKRSSIRTS